MNLLVVSQYFWPESFRINDLVRSLAKRGARVTVLTGKPNYPGGEVFDGYTAGGIVRESLDQVAVLRVPMMPRGRPSGLRLAANYLSFMLSAAVLAPVLLRRQRIDAILVYAPSPLLQALAAVPIKLLKRAPLVVWVQDLWPESLQATGYVRSRTALKAVELVVRFIYRCCDRILIQSEAFRAPVARLADPAKIEYFPNPADDAVPAAGPEQGDGPAASIDPGVFSVVFAGNLGTAQMLEVIVGAAVSLRDRDDIRFYLVGDGSRADWVRARIAQHRLDNLAMLGQHPARTMPALFARASALLVTLRDEEIFALTVPSKIQAYLAAGRPILAALDGEGGRIVREAGAGFVCRSGDSAGLADAVVRMAALPVAERQRMGEAGRRYHERHFDLGRLSGELLERLQTLSDSTRGGGDR
jgi:glycosyltransferase involved in cell wall biosynthesis